MDAMNGWQEGMKWIDEINEGNEGIIWMSIYKRDEKSMKIH